jgi:hypothetical protein
VEFVNAVPHDRIVQIHLAGHTNFGTHIIDTHEGHVAEPVWDLYRLTIEKAGSVSTLIEWDDALPELEVLLAEAERARQERERALAARAARTTSLDAAALASLQALSAGAHEALTRREPWKQGGAREHASTAESASAANGAAPT